MRVFCDVGVLALDILQTFLIVIFVFGGKYNESKLRTGIFFVVTVCLLGISYLVNNQFLYGNRNLLLCMIMLKLCFDYKIIKSILCGFITFAITSFVSYIFIGIFEQCGMGPKEYLEVLGGIASTVIIILLIFILKKTIRRTVNVSQNVWLSLIVGAFLFLLFYLIGYPYFASDEFHTIRFLIYVLSIAILMVSLGVLFIYMSNQNSELKISQRVSEEKNKLMHDYYSQLEERDIEIRKFRHDYKNHVRGILYYIGEEKYDELKKYAETISEVTESYNALFDVGHNYINAILNSCYAEAKKDNITIAVSGNVGSAKYVEDYDWSIIIPNMLNNAIEATREVEESKRRIKVSIKNNGNKVIISVTNPVTEGINLKTIDKEKTSKKDKLNHGYGIQNIKKSVEKYHGDLSYEINENNQFVMVVWL